MTGWLNCKKNNRIIPLLFLALLFLGCEKEKQPEVIIAKVGDSILTENQLDSLLSFSENKNKYEEEVIRKWVDSELLFLEAKKKGITETNEYNVLSNSSNKKLAGVLYLNEFLENSKEEIDESSLQNYFINNSKDFEISEKAFVYNRAVFRDESKAILFRSTLNESDWNKASNVFLGNEALISSRSNIFKYLYEIDSKKVKISLGNLETGEISIIFESSPGEYNVLQLVKKYEAGTIPDFSYIKKNVTEQYESTLKTAKYVDLLNNLYSKYDVIINR